MVQKEHDTEKHDGGAHNHHELTHGFFCTDEKAYTSGDANGHVGIYTRAWILTLAIAGVELIGSIISGSFALLADVSHVFTDTIVGLAPISIEYAKRKKGLDAKRLEAVGGIVVSFVLFFVGYEIMHEAAQQFPNGSIHKVSGFFMFVFSILAASGNYMQHRLLSRVSPIHRHAVHNGFHFHILTDLIKNLILPLLAVVIYFGGPEGIDAYAGYAIGFLVIIRAFLLALESMLGKLIVQKALDRFLHWIMR